MNLYRVLRRDTLWKIMTGAEPFYWVKQKPEVMEFGSRYGRWGIDTSKLSRSTVVVSFGLGEDVTFEQALVDRFACLVYGFDPTPRSIKFTTANITTPKFTTAPYALANHEGTLALTAPPEGASDQVSGSSVANYGCTNGPNIEVPCVTLASAKTRCKIQKIDVLKMDIEGAEYAVIEQAIKNGWLKEVSQLLVEFHHFLPGLSSSHTRRAIASIQNDGFQISWIGRTNHEYLFTRVGS